MQDLDYNGEPFAFNPARRAVLRAELDAYYAKLYGPTWGKLRYILRYILDPTDVLRGLPSQTFRVFK